MFAGVGTMTLSAILLMLMILCLSLVLVSTVLLVCMYRTSHCNKTSYCNGNGTSHGGDIPLDIKGSEGEDTDGQSVRSASADKRSVRSQFSLNSQYSQLGQNDSQDATTHD